MMERNVPRKGWQNPWMSIWKFIQYQDSKIPQLNAGGSGRMPKCVKFQECQDLIGVLCSYLSQTLPFPTWSLPVQGWWCGKRAKRRVSHGGTDFLLDSNGFPGQSPGKEMRTYFSLPSLILRKTRDGIHDEKCLYISSFFFHFIHKAVNQTPMWT